MTALLAFIHARKWLVELILFAVIVAGVYLFCQHLIQVGVQKQKDADAKELVELQRKADLETGRLQGKADAASHIHDQELADLRLYRSTHPLHGGLCINQGRSNLPSATAANTGDAGAAAGQGDVQSLSPGDPSASGQRDADIRGMLDTLAARADFLSAQVREWQGR